MKFFSTTKLAVTVFWSIAFALYFMAVNYAGDPLAIFAKLGPELVLMTAVALCRGSVLSCFALFFSMIGDISGEFKALPVHGELALELQIGFFVLAHICYVVDFVRHTNYHKKEHGWRIAAFVGAGITLFYTAIVGYIVFTYGNLWSLPVKICSALYLVMLISLIVTASQQSRGPRIYYMMGAIFFIFSDSVIALRTFVCPIPHSATLVMSTYFIAQYLLNFPHITHIHRKSRVSGPAVSMQ